LFRKEIIEMNNRKLLAAILPGIMVLLAGQTGMGQSREYRVLSPDKKTEAVLSVKDGLSLTISHNSQKILTVNSIALLLEKDISFGKAAVVENAKTKSVKAEIQPVLPEKRRVIPDVYNELTVQFKGRYGLRIRAYDDGVAYRFFSSLPGEIVVKNEEFVVQCSPDDSLFFGEEKSFLSHSERLYPLLAAAEISDSQFCVLPAVIAKANGWKIAVTESDLLDYPGLYLKGMGQGTAAFRALLPPYPLEEELVGDRTVRVKKAADYIAKTAGTREFPWRLFAIAEKDGDLIENDIVYRLGSPLKLKDTGWIKPGKVAWDWWNASNVFGVNFKSGINTATYEYYIDFASKYGLEYIILDEGWSKPADLFQINPQMNMEELLAYAKSKNVGIILWMTSKALNDRLPEALDRFEKWGVKGVKVDFMQRDDQVMVNFYERVAVEAAERKLLVDFHGAYKPTGLSRAYPHLLTREGVYGLEQSKWATTNTPEEAVTIPFTRMFAGPMDYTPGAMRNAAKGMFAPIFDQPMSQGTRCHQLAMYVVYESPLQMLSDAPSMYLREPEVMEFLSAVPTTWDETRALNAKAGDYLTVARKKGNDWYVGSMTDWTPRDWDIDLSFLGEGKYQALIFADGLNADRFGSDYTKSKRDVAKGDKLTIHLAPGGGWAAIFKKM
jgi:alpha-glucosidase